MVKPPTTGKGVKTDLNRDAMDIDALPESLKEYGRKIESDDVIDLTEMFMAFARSLRPIEETVGELTQSVESLNQSPLPLRSATPAKAVFLS